MGFEASAGSVRAHAQRPVVVLDRALQVAARRCADSPRVEELGVSDREGRRLGRLEQAALQRVRRALQEQPHSAGQPGLPPSALAAGGGRPRRRGLRPERGALCTAGGRAAGWLRGLRGGAGEGARLGQRSFGRAVHQLVRASVGGRVVVEAGRDCLGRVGHRPGARRLRCTTRYAPTRYVRYARGWHAYGARTVLPSRGKLPCTSGTYGERTSGGRYAYPVRTARHGCGTLWLHVNTARRLLLDALEALA